MYQVDGAVCTQWPQINVIISHNLDGWWAAEPAFVDEHFPSNRCDHQMSIGAKIHHQLQTKACSGQRASENGDENMRRSFINSNLNLRIFENGSIWFGWNFIARPLFNWMVFFCLCAFLHCFRPLCFSTLIRRHLVLRHFYCTIVFSVSIFHIWPLFLCIRVCNCLRHTFHVFFSNAMVCVFPEYFKHLLMHNAHSATSWVFKKLKKKTK